jgi:hypothetical protein
MAKGQGRIEDGIHLKISFPELAEPHIMKWVRAET